MVITLKQGSKGEEVADLQARLKQLGYGIAVDGDYGPKTAAAVEQYQRKNGLLVDGKAGEKTLGLLYGASQAQAGKFLSELDIQDAAKLLGVDEAAIKAVHAVESLGVGFLPNGKPKILFERHKFREFLLKTHSREAVRQFEQKWPQLVSSKPGGYKGGAAEWVRYDIAAGIDKEAAALATSWGVYQIMGFNHKAAGFDSVQAFVAAMQLNEGEHLKAFCRFIQANPAMHKALAAKNWAEFAERYNGKNYRINLYDVKLARAYEQFGGKS